MTDEHEKMLSPILSHDVISPDSHPTTTPTPKHGSHVHGLDPGLAIALSTEPHTQQL